MATKAKNESNMETRRKIALLTSDCVCKGDKLDSPAIATCVATCDDLINLVIVKYRAAITATRYSTERYVPSGWKEQSKRPSQWTVRS